MNSQFEEFCTIKPSEWNCKIYSEKFDSLPLPDRLEKPLAIVEYSHEKNNSSDSLAKSEIVYFYIYDISKKSELEKILKESMIYAHCIPVFVGENDLNFVVTSSCNVNSEFFSAKESRKQVIDKLFNRSERSLFK